MGPLGGANLRLCSPQRGTSLYRKTTGAGLVHRVVCPVYLPAEADIHLQSQGGWLSRPDLVDWFHTKMVYLPEDGHPYLSTSRIRRRLTSLNLIRTT